MPSTMCMLTNKFYSADELINVCRTPVLLLQSFENINGISISTCWRFRAIVVPSIRSLAFGEHTSIYKLYMHISVHVLSATNRFGCIFHLMTYWSNTNAGDWHWLHWTYIFELPWCGPFLLTLMHSLDQTLGLFSQVPSAAQKSILFRVQKQWNTQLISSLDVHSHLKIKVGVYLGILILGIVQQSNYTNRWSQMGSGCGLGKVSRLRFELLQIWVYAGRNICTRMSGTTWLTFYEGGSIRSKEEMCCYNYYLLVIWISEFLEVKNKL